MRENVFQILKATLAAAIFSLLCALVFSFVAGMTGLPSEVIKPVNQVLKTAAIAFGGMIFIRGSRGLAKGAVYGACAVVATFLLFSAVSATFALAWTFVLEMALGAVAGGVSGVIAVNMTGRG